METACRWLWCHRAVPLLVPSRTSPGLWNGDHPGRAPRLPGPTGLATASSLAKRAGWGPGRQRAVRAGSKTEATELCWGLSFELWGPLWLQLSSRTGTPDGTASSALPVILMERWGSQSRFLSGPRLLPPAFLQMRHLTAPGHLVILTPLLTATT